MQSYLNSSQVGYNLYVKVSSFHNICIQHLNLIKEISFGGFYATKL